MPVTVGSGDFSSSAEPSSCDPLMHTYESPDDQFEQLRLQMRATGVGTYVPDGPSDEPEPGSTT